MVDEGAVVFDGDPIEAVSFYRELMFQRSVGELA